MKDRDRVSARPSNLSMNSVKCREDSDDGQRSQSFGDQKIAQPRGVKIDQKKANGVLLKIRDDIFVAYDEITVVYGNGNDKGE